MYELIQISEHDYYMQSPAKIGLVKLNDTEVFQLCREILYGNGRFPDIGNLYGIIKGNQTCCRTEQQHPERKFS